MSEADEHARRHLNAVRQAITCIEAPGEVDRRLADAMADLRRPRSLKQYRAAAEIARHGLIYVHDRPSAAYRSAKPFLVWMEQLVNQAGTPLSDDYLLLLEAIDSGKQDDPLGAIASARMAVTRDRVSRLLPALGGSPGEHPEIEDLAAVQLRCMAEMGRGLRLLGASAATLADLELLVDALGMLEAYAENLSGFALYRARLSVAYAQRDLAGDWSDASRRLEVARNNRPHDARTDLTSPLHDGSLLRLDAATQKGWQHYQVALATERRARALEDACLERLTTLGFERHVRSFRRFRDMFGGM